MKKLIVVLLFIVVSFPAFAQSSTPLFDSFAKLKSFSANLTQVNHYPGNDNYTHTGKVQILRPQKAVWDYGSEYFVLTPKGAEHYSSMTNQLVRVKVDTSNVNDPTSLLLSVFLDSEKIRDRFHVTEKGNTVTLIPKNLPDLKWIIIAFKNGSISTVSSKDSSGNSMEITFTNVQNNPQIKSSDLDRVVPKGTDIIEQ